MIIIYAILLASAGLSSLSEASAIKGHAQQPQRPLLEEGRSIKLGQVDKMAKSAGPVLESTKKIYNDESIRRLAQPQQPLHQSAPAPLEEVAPTKQVAAPAEPIVPPKVAQEQPTVVQKALVEPLVQQAPVQVEKKPESSVVVKEAPLVVPVVPVAPQVEAKSAVAEQKQVAPVDQKVAPIEPKIAVPVEPKVETVAKDLPAQSERSAQPTVAEKPTVEASPVAVAPVEPVVSAKLVQEQPAVVQKVAEPVVQKAPVQPELVKDSPLEAKKDEVVGSAPVAAPVPVPVPVSAPAPAVEPLHIEVPAPDPGLVLSEPIDSTTKLLIDLDEHVQKFLPAEEQQAAQPAKDQVLVPGVDFSPASSGAEQTSGKSAPLVPYSGLDEPIVPPLPSLEGVEKASAASGSSSVASPAGGSSVASSPSASRQANNSPQNQQQVITQLLDQLDSLQNRIQDTINQLVARRRYVMSALLRPMGTYVRRVRTNLERLQTRVNQLQAAAVSVGGGNGPSRPGGFVDAAAIETIRRRIDDISKRISDIVNRIRFSLTPTSAPLNSNGRK